MKKGAPEDLRVGLCVQLRLLCPCAGCLSGICLREGKQFRPHKYGPTRKTIIIVDDVLGAWQVRQGAPPRLGMNPPASDF